MTRNQRRAGSLALVSARVLCCACLVFAASAGAQQGGDSGGVGASWLRGLSGLLGGGNSAAGGGANVPLGIRGLQREDLANAQPDPAAVTQLERYVVSAAQAGELARASGLRAVDVAYLEAPPPPRSAVSERRSGGSDN